MPLARGFPPHPGSRQRRRQRQSARTGNETIVPIVAQLHRNVDGSVSNEAKGKPVNNVQNSPTKVSSNKTKLYNKIESNRTVRVGVKKGYRSGCNRYTDTPSNSTRSVHSLLLLYYPRGLDDLRVVYTFNDSRRFFCFFRCYSFMFRYSSVLFLFFFKFSVCAPFHYRELVMFLLRAVVVSIQCFVIFLSIDYC